MFTRAKKIGIAALTALALTGGVVASATPAAAQYWRWHHYYPYYPYSYHHHYGWFPGAVVGGLVGGALAGVFGAPYYPYDYYGYYGYYGGPYYYHW